MKQFISLLSFWFLLSTAVYSQVIPAKQNVAGRTPGGMYYELYSKATGDSAREGDVLKLRVTQTVNDSVVYSSHGNMLPTYTTVEAITPYDISELWRMVKKGDSLYTVQLMDTFIRRNPDFVLPQYKKGDSIKMYVKVSALFTSDSLAKADQKKERDAQLQKEIEFIAGYLTNLYIRAKTTPGGAFVDIIEAGTGKNIDSASVVSVMYRAMSFDGVVIDTNMDDSFGHTEPLEARMGQGNYIKGFEEGLMLLREGSIARMYIPSMLGYAENSLPSIKPLTNLIYEVRIISVKK